MSSDIPSYKLRSSSFKSIFKHFQIPSSSESSCKNAVDIIYKTEISKIKKRLIDEPAFIIIDRAKIKRQKFINIPIGSLKKPLQVGIVELFQLILLQISE
ncbi:hypothetical protein CDIK_2257 [Cucumispora dikerogammari]|nr:hypothetical protein CDIK_2257 [Cucumispora dikerogammari]